MKAKRADKLFSKENVTVSRTKLSAAQIEAKLAKLDDWQLVDDLWVQLTAKRVTEQIEGQQDTAAGTGSNPLLRRRQCAADT